MSIAAICAAAVVTAALALLLRQQSPQSAMLMSLAAGGIIVLSLIGNLPTVFSGVSAILTDAGVDSAVIAILFKVMGICFVTEFTCDCVTEAGLMSLSTNVSFAGKILVLLTALPLFNNILAVIEELSSG